MKIKWQTFSIQLNNLTEKQANEVENMLWDIQQELELKFDTTGGDFIAVDSGEIES